MIDLGGTLVFLSIVFSSPLQPPCGITTLLKRNRKILGVIQKFRFPFKKVEQDRRDTLGRDFKIKIEIFNRTIEYGNRRFNILKRRMVYVEKS